MASVNPVPSPEDIRKPEAEQEVATAPAEEQPIPGKPFVVTGRAGAGGGKDKTKTIIVGFVVLVILLVSFFGLISTKGKTKQKTTAEAGKPNLGRVVTPSAPGQIVPSENTAAPIVPDTKAGALDAHDIEKTRVPSLSNKTPDASVATSSQPTASSRAANGKALGQINQFQQPDTDPQHTKNWGPAPYAGDHPDQPQANGSSESTQQARAEQEQYGKASMVFVAHQNNAPDKSSSLLQPAIDNFGLASGYHVAARLESMASTALNAPVTAVVEYNYQRDGRVLIPAGARAIGKISQADPSGVMNITFTAIELPTGESTPISAIGATTSLQAIKGQVSGKNAGRSLAVRSLAGLGEAGAMLVGQGSVNSAVSESDMIRQRAAENIGSGADQQVMSLMTTQHIVVSVPAGTEIYLIFTKSQRVSPTASQTINVSTNGTP